MEKRGRGEKAGVGVQKLRARLLPYLITAFLLCFLFLPFSLLPVSPFPLSRADSLVSTETPEGRLAVFDDVWQTIRDRYYDSLFNGLDWAAERARFRPLAERAKSSAEFYSILRRMLGSLRDAHTRVYAPDEKFDWRRPRVITTGVSVREVEGLPVVVRVEPGSQAERAGLRAGDIITSVDNEAAGDLLAKRLEDAAGTSTPQSARARRLAALLAGQADTTVRVGWRNGAGQERFATLRREWRDRTARLVIEKAAGDFFVVRFDAFTQGLAREFVRALENRLRRARGLVLDLRHNGGGEAEAMTDVASVFLSRGIKLGRFTDRAGRVMVEPQTRGNMVLAAESINRFDGSVVVLTSERTASAAEIFVASLKEARRAVLIGTSTCGCVLAIRRSHVLPDGGELDISEFDYRTGRGARLEGAGVAPDETITIELADLRAGRDRALEQALKRLRVQSGE
jgi:carboxyl-terminal processing protease